MMLSVAPRRLWIKWLPITEPCERPAPPVCVVGFTWLRGCPFDRAMLVWDGAVRGRPSAAASGQRHCFSLAGRLVGIEGHCGPFAFGTLASSTEWPDGVAVDGLCGSGR